MNIDEFQIWFQAYLTGVQARSIGQPTLIKDAIYEGCMIADEALKRYKTCDKPNVADLSNIMKDAVNSLTKSIK